IHRLLSRSMVDIYVGPENTHWILHEKLLCARSKFFSAIFYKKSSSPSSSKDSSPSSSSSSSGSGNKTFGLPDEEDEPFRLFVGWLYSSSIIPPEEEKDLGDLFDLYLMGEKWSITGLVKDVLEAVRKYYRTTETYPGLRRVQYIYANTDSESPMRKLLVSSVARMLALKESIPAHWDKALRKNGQLAVDLIVAIQEWHIKGEDVPDPREAPLQTEKDKVKNVEKLEGEQTGVAKGQEKEKEQEKKEEKPLTNGYPNSDNSE
ncbi:hypothetical protein EJ08DRAFT_585962, partial [Tothia fuscella]